MFVIVIAIKYLYILECLHNAQSKAIMHRYAYMKMNDTRIIISKRKIEENMGTDGEKNYRSNVTIVMVNITNQFY